MSHEPGSRFSDNQHWCCDVVVENDGVGCFVGPRSGEVKLLARDVSVAVAAFDLVGAPEQFEVAGGGSAERLLEAH
jgi:hypothetical protein